MIHPVRRRPTASAAAPPTAPPVDEAELKRLKALTRLALRAQEAAAELNAAGGLVPPRDEPVLGADISWPQCPPGMGIPHKISTGAADAPRRRGVRRHRAHQRSGLPRQPVPGRPGRLREGARAPRRGVLGDQLARRGRTGAVRRPGGGRPRAGAVQPPVDEGRRPRLADHLARRRAGAALRVVDEHRRQRRGGARRREGLRRGRLPRGRLLHPRHLGRHRRRPQPGRAGVARGRPDLAGRGREPLRPGLGRSRAARPCWRSGSRTAATATSRAPAWRPSWGSTS